MVRKLYARLATGVFALFSVAALAQVTVILPANPHTPGDNSSVTQAYRDQIARSVAAPYIAANPVGFTLNIVFSDKAEQSFSITIEGSTYSVNAIPGTYKNKPAPFTASRDCVSGAAQSVAIYNGPGTPLYRATYNCIGNTCVLVSAVLIGHIGGLPTWEQLDAFGGYCSSGFNV
jgi:hypothetical protein